MNDEKVWAREHCRYKHYAVIDTMLLYPKFTVTGMIRRDGKLRCDVFFFFFNEYDYIFMIVT